jgi:spore coat polysaccharide biosynthesis protein SpsF
MKTGVIVAARTGSRRLPGKALLPLLGIPMVSFLIRRLKPSIRTDCLVLATTHKTEDDQLEKLARDEQIICFRGDEKNLIKRYLDAARKYDIDRIVRITADCPFVSAETLDYCLSLCDEQTGYDLASTKKLFPVGVDYEIFSSKGLAYLYERCRPTEEEKEHLTLHIVNHPIKFNIIRLIPKPQWRWQGREFTVDTRQDYEWIAGLAAALGRIDFTLEELLGTAKNES